MSDFVDLYSSAAYPAAYGQFQQALAQHATLLPTAQKEGKNESPPLVHILDA